MEVSQHSKTVTHAIIGQFAAIECGITEDASFYQMLSSSLYRYPKLAMIREVICNSWDAHIMNGEARPIEITFTDTQMKFRDFGPGIPFEAIGRVYGIYGGSTKKKDVRQTGGFGLGCKSPYAYTDHFEVSSFNGGIKTIYQMAKSSGAVIGKPSITPIVQIPTTETGLEVVIDFVNNNDKTELLQLIQGVVRNGGKPTLLNGVLLNAIDYSNANRGYIITSNIYSAERTINGVFLKNGDVIYPITEHADYTSELHAVQWLLRRINGRGAAGNVVLIAEPGTISIAPSRENVTLDSYTSAAIKTLLKNFYKEIVNSIKPYYKTVIDETLNAQTFSRATINKAIHYRGGWLMKPDEAIPVNKEELNNPMAVAVSILSAQFPQEESFAKRELSERYKRIRDTLPRDRKGVIDRIIEVEKGTSPLHRLNDNYLQKVFVPLVSRRLKKIGIGLDRLNYVNTNVYGRSWGADTYDNKIPRSITKAKACELDNVVQFLEARIVLGRKSKNLHSRVCEFIEENSPRPYGYLCQEDRQTKSAYWFIEAPSSTIELNKLREVMQEEFGDMMIDMTIKHRWEIKTQENKPKAVTRKKNIYPCISGTVDRHNNTYFINTHMCKLESCPTIEKPVFIDEVSYRGQTGKSGFGYFIDGDLSLPFVKLFGHLGAVYSTETQRKALTSKGAVPVDEWLKAKIEEKLTKDWKFRKHIHYDSNRTTKDIAQYSNHRIGKLIESKSAMKILGLKFEHVFSEEDLFWLKLIKKVANSQYNWVIEKLFTEKSLKILNNLKDPKNTPKKVRNMWELASKSELLRIINVEAIDPLIESGSKKALQILTTALKGEE